MKRRKFLSMLGGAATLGPALARAQTRALPVVGFLNSTSPAIYAFNASAFREGLREAGFVEGQNVTIEYRWADNDYQRLPALASELAQRQVDVIAATGDIASARAAAGATRTIPIVFTVGSDPVQSGLVESLSRPRGNVTGITFLSNTLGAKRLELLRDVVPDAPVIALLMNPSNQNVAGDVQAAQEAAKSLGRQTIVVNANTASEFGPAFEAAVQKRAGAILVASDPTLLGYRDQLAMLAARLRIPVMYWTREFVAAGGLMSYGPSITWMYHAAGAYCGRILKGAKPGDLPILQPSKFYFIINLKTAKALGLTLPAPLLLRADEVIQ